MLNCDARLETPWRARVGILLHQVLKHRTMEVGLFGVALTSSNGSGYHNIELPVHAPSPIMEPNSTVAGKKRNGAARQAIAGTELNQLELLHALHAMRAGDFSVRLPGHQSGVAFISCHTFNPITAANQRMAQRLE